MSVSILVILNLKATVHQNGGPKTRKELRKARSSRNKDGIKHAEMDYFHVLQHLYATGQDVVAEGVIELGLNLRCCE